MDGRRIGAIAVVAGLLLLWASWTWLRTQPGEPAGESRSSPGGGLRSANTPPPSPFAQRDAGVASAAARAGSVGDGGIVQLTLAGKVFKQGGPAAGAEVRYGEHRALSAEDGSFELSAPCDGLLGLVARQGALASVVRAFDCARPPSYPGLVLVLRGTSSVRGEVRDEAGKPLRATVRIWAPAAEKVETDELGRFLFAQIPADDYDLHAVAEGFRSRTIERVQVMPGESVGVLIELHREATISGKVVDAAGAPIGGAEVAAKLVGVGPGGRKPTARTAVADAAGLFQVAVRDGSLYRVEASARGWASRVQMAQAPAAGLVLALSRGGEVGGAVRTKAGVPLAGAKLELRHEVQKKRSVESDAEGRYVFENVSAGAWRLVVSKEGFAEPKAVEVEVVEEVYAARDVVLEPADGTLAGRVVEAGSDKPLPGAEVECEGQKATSDARGRFRFAGLVPGRREVCASAEARVEGCKTFQTGEEEAQLELLAGRVVRGRVLEEPGVPLDGFYLDDEWVDAADGVFRVVRSLTAKKVEARCFGRRNAVREIAADAAGEVDLGDIVLPVGWPVTFRVKTPEGRPVPGAHVWGMSYDGWMPELIEDGDAQQVGVADGAGELRAVLDDGKHCYRATGRGWASSTTEAGLHQFKGPATVELVLRPAARLSGRVMKGGAPLKGAVVGVEHLPDATAMADEGGRYRFEAVEPGRVNVFLGSFGKDVEIRGKAVELAPGEEKVLNFGEPDRGSLLGTLLCPGPVEVFVLAVPGAVDLAKLDEGPPPEGFAGRLVAMVQGRGAFELADLPAGRVSLVVSWSKTEKSRRSTQVVELRPGERKRLDLSCDAK
ncbi:MAG TPA: carboxypeptidase-like regulatory domain-containing protein [Myxococcales bacterium]|jgi:hypothetical protein